MRDSARIPGWAILTLGIIFFLALYFRDGLGLIALTNAKHDDALFFRATEHLLAGDWLGPYDQLTFVKGVWTSILAALSAYAGIPFKTLEMFIYLLASLSIVLIVYSKSRSAILAVTLFFLLSFNPFFWSQPGLRFIREPLYVALSLGVFSATVATLFCADRIGQRLFYGLVLGLLFGAFWLTREESVWIYPSMAFLVMYFLLQEEQGNPFPVFLKIRLKNLAIATFSVIIGFSAIVFPVAWMNNEHYSKLITNELRGLEMKRAMGALMRVNPKARSPYIPVSKAALKNIYEHSPSAALLRPSLEGSTGMNWARFGGDLGGEEGEIAGGWFIWALRDAAASAGFHTDARSAASYYERLADEIDGACSAGLLSCGASRTTLAPTLRRENISGVMKSSFQAFRMILRLEVGLLQPGNSIDRLGNLANWHAVLGHLASSRGVNRFSTYKKISGSLFFESESADLAVALLGDGAELVELRRSDDGEKVRSFYRTEDLLRGVSFELTARCGEGSCFLLVLRGESILGEFPIEELGIGSEVVGSGIVLDIFGVEEVVRLPDGLRAAPLIQEERKFVAISSYATWLQPLLYTLWVSGLFGFMFYFAARGKKRKVNILAVVGISALIAVMVRAGLIGYIDNTAWRAVNVSYLSPAYPFGLVAVAIGNFLLVFILMGYGKTHWQASKREWAP